MTEGPLARAEAPDFEVTAGTGEALDVRLWLRLLTCTTMMERELRRVLKDAFAITMPRFDALAQLERAPDGLTMGELSRRMMVSNANLTGVIDRLAGDGLVERHAVPGDRRASLLRLTAAGRRAFYAMTPAHHARVAAMLAGLGRDDAERLFALLARLKASIRDAQAAGADGDDGKGA